MSAPESEPKRQTAAEATVRRLLADRPRLVRRLFIGEAIGERRKVRPPIRPPVAED